MAEILNVKNLSVRIGGQTSLTVSYTHLTLPTT